MDSYTLAMPGTRLSDARIGESPVHPEQLVRGAYWRVLTALGSRPISLDRAEDRYWFGDARREAFADNIHGEVWAVIDPLGWYAMLPQFTFALSVGGDDGGAATALDANRDAAQISVVRDAAADRWSGVLIGGHWYGRVSEAPPAEVLYDAKAAPVEGDRVQRVGLRRGRAAGAKRVLRKRR